MGSITHSSDHPDPDYWRRKIRQFLWNLIKKKWFWILVILLFILAIIFDFSVAIIWAFQTLVYTHWDPYVFWFGISAAVLGAVCAKRKFLENKPLKDISLLLFFIDTVLAIRDYGFWRALVFIIAILFLGRILTWVTPKRKVLKRVS